MNVGKTMTVVCCLALAGCAGGNAWTSAAARTAAACPVGTVKYCESLFEEPGSGPRGCGCAEMPGAR
jgi:hypothetical protein